MKFYNNKIKDESGIYAHQVANVFLLELNLTSKTQELWTDNLAMMSIVGLEKLKWVQKL